MKVKILKVERAVNKDGSLKTADQHGNYAWNVSFNENGEDKRALYIGKNQGYFDIGKDVEVEIESKVSSGGFPWLKITKPKAAENGTKMRSFDDPMEIRQIQKTVCINAAIEIISKTEGIETSERASIIADKLSAWIDTQNPKDKKERISVQSSIKCAVASLSMEKVCQKAKAIPMEARINYILSAAKVYYEYITSA